MALSKPAFEVCCGDHTFRVWADGRIEGFPSQNRCAVINRIPQIANAYVLEALELDKGR